jgi:hypothetical protein
LKGPLTFILGLTLAGGVQPRPPYALRTPFLDSDFRPWSKPGPAAISGQAFLRTVGGDVKTCAGQDVSLMPGTQYNDGRFSFGGLSARLWIVVVDVTWSVPGENGLERQGGVLSKTVDVPGQMRSFYLARTKFPSVRSFSPERSLPFGAPPQEAGRHLSDVLQMAARLKRLAGFSPLPAPCGARIGRL